MNTIALERAIALQECLIEDTAAIADRLEDKAEHMTTPRHRRETLKTAERVRSRLSELVPHLNNLKALRN